MLCTATGGVYYASRNHYLDDFATATGDVTSRDYLFDGLATTTGGVRDIFSTV